MSGVAVCLEVLEKTTQTPVQVIRAVGGAANKPLQAKLRASILGKPFELFELPI